PSRLSLGQAFPYHLDARGIYEPDLALRFVTLLAILQLLLPTFLMGTTFPILCSALRARSTFPSELYACNTLGACCGILAAEFILLPLLGHSRAFEPLIGANVALGMAFLLLSDSRHRPEGVSHLGRESPGEEAGSRSPIAKSRRQGRPWTGEPYTPGTAYAVAVLSGLLCGALEVDLFRAVRFAGAITDAAMSLTSFWAITAIVLGSCTVRALGQPRSFVVRGAIPAALAVYALTWRSLATIRGWYNAHYMTWLATHTPQGAIAPGVTVYPFSASLAVLLGFTGVVVFPVYYLLSLLLPTICNALQDRREHLGIVYGLNTLAFCAGAVLFSWIAPSVSLFYAVKVLFAVLAAGAVLAFTLRPGRPLSRAVVTGTLLAVVAAAACLPRGFDASFFPSDELPARHPVRALRSNGVYTTYVVSAANEDI